MTVLAAPGWFVPNLSALRERRELDSPAMTAMMEGFLHGECNETEIEELLLALREKGETAQELASAAAVMRRHCQRLDVGSEAVLDTCGTGGDGASTFNISTATAIVVAAAGVRVVKHGNRAVSSNSGSADVLGELGVTISGDPERARRCLDGAGIAFCMAPLYHPALKHVGAVRRRLGVTLFNCLGPLANPARAPYQLIGVGRAEWLDRMAGALAALGTRFALLVHARDGLDEVSLSAPTMVRQVRGNEIAALEWTPNDFRLAPCELSELRVDGARASAGIIRGILEGDDGPASRIVKANAAAALLAAGAAGSLLEGVDRAAIAISSGRARATLEALVEQSADR